MIDREKKRTVNTEADRIVWLDCLRAVAVSLVVWGHIFLVGINDPKIVSIWVPSVRDFIFGPGSASRNPNSNIAVLMWTYTGTGPGGLGVALFFLISGFVILRTVDRTPPEIFLVQRFFRIVPVCTVAGVATAMGTNAIFINAGLHIPNTFASVLASSFALADLCQQFPSTPVLWTLSAEILFYLIIAATAWIVSGQIGFRALAMVSMICLTGVLFARSPIVTEEFSSYLATVSVYLSRLLAYVSFMLIGAVVYRGHSERRFIVTLVFGVFSCAVCALIYFEFAGLNGGLVGGVWPAEAAVALVTFLGAFALNLRGLWMAPLRWIASISYPLYLVHAPLSWVLLAWLATLGLGMISAGLVSTIIVVLVAWVVHLVIERPAHQLGRAFGRPKIALPTAQIG